MRIVSLNLRYAHTADMNNQGVREPRIVNFVKSFRPDVIGVQECEPFWRERLIATIGQFRYVSAQSAVLVEDGISAFKNFIWYNSQNNELIDEGKIWLSETPDVPSQSFGSKSYISAGYAVLKNKTTGECVAYVNTHLHAFNQHRRIAELNVLKTKIKELDSKGYSVFIMGDFNDDENSDVYRSMTEELLDARKTAKVSTEMNTFNSYESEGVIINDDEYLRIDYCFYNGNKTGDTINKFDVVDRWGDGYMSDHNALVIDIDAIKTQNSKQQ